MTIRPIPLQDILCAAGDPLKPPARGNNRDWLPAELEKPTLPVAVLIMLQELAGFLPVAV